MKLLVHFRCQHRLHSCSTVVVCYYEGEHPAKKVIVYLLVSLQVLSFLRQLKPFYFLLQFNAAIFLYLVLKPHFFSSILCFR